MRFWRKLDQARQFLILAARLYASWEEAVNLPSLAHADSGPPWMQVRRLATRYHDYLEQYGIDRTELLEILILLLRRCPNQVFVRSPEECVAYAQRQGWLDYSYRPME